MITPPRDPLLSHPRIDWDWLLPATKREYLRALAVIAARFPAHPASHTRTPRTAYAVNATGAAVGCGQHTAEPTRTPPTQIPPTTAPQDRAPHDRAPQVCTPQIWAGS